MPKHKPKFTWETCDELTKYFKDVKEILDNGIPLMSIPQFATDKVLICGQLFPTDDYPAQDVIDQFTPRPMNGRAENPVRTAQLATYLRDLKMTLKGGGDIYNLTLDWPAMLKGDDWPGERHE